MSSLDIPIHPATVHFPITFLSTAFGLDALLAIAPSILPASILDLLPSPTELSHISYYALSLGLLTALPSVTSGVAQALAAYKAQGLYEADGQTIKTKFKVIGAHAAIMDSVVLGSAWLWWQRSASDAADVSVGNLGRLAVATVLGGSVLFAAHLGGKLTYNFGMGMSAGKSKKK